MRSLLVLAVLCAAAPARAEKPEPALFVVVQIDPPRGGFGKALADELANARRERLKPYVEFWAPWCEACVIFKNSLGHPRIREALAGTYLIMANVDQVGDEMGRRGFAPESIPVFYELREDGRPSGRKMDGGVWGSDRPENMALWLDRFFHGRKRRRAP